MVFHYYFFINQQSYVNILRYLHSILKNIKLKVFFLGDDETNAFIHSSQDRKTSKPRAGTESKSSFFIAVGSES